jgi:hypothetical protein
MAFTAAINWFKTYRKHRRKALRNLAVMQWSTANVATYTALMQDTFGSDAENTEWDTLKTNNGTHASIQKARLKVAFLAGCRHDLRNQFAVARLHEPKTIIDFDRHAFSDTIACDYRLAMLAQSVATK